MAEKVDSGLIDTNTQPLSGIPVTITSIIRKAKKPKYPDDYDPFFRRYATPIFRYFRARGLKHEVAKDRTGIIIVKLLDGKLLRNFNLDKPFRPYLLTILRRETSKQFIRERKDLELLKRLAEFLEKLPNAIASGGLTPEQILDLEYARQLFVLAIEQVRHKCAINNTSTFRWEMFYERYFENLPWPEIANRHGLERDKARNVTLTALGWLRKALFDELKLEGLTGKQAEEELEYLLNILGDFNE